MSVQEIILNCQNCESLYGGDGHLCKILCGTPDSINSYDFYCTLHKQKPKKPQLPEKLAEDSFPGESQYKECKNKINQILEFLYLQAKRSAGT